MIQVMFFFFLIIYGSGSSLAADYDFDDPNLINDPNLGLMARNICSKKSNIIQNYTQKTQDAVREAEQNRREDMELSIQIRSEQESIKRYHEENIIRQQVNLNLLEQRQTDIENLAVHQQDRLSLLYKDQLKGTPSQTSLVTSMTHTVRTNTTEINRHAGQWDAHLADFDFAGVQREIDEHPRFIGLSLDGGGIRGLIPALLLQHIEENAGGKKIYELVDFIGGTSVGGILSLGLSCSKPNQLNPFSAQELVSFFREHRTTIFPYVDCKEIKQIFTNIYPPEGLEGLLLNYFGHQQTLRDTIKPVLITAITDHQQPFTFETSKANTSPIHNFYIKDVARATSAAPTYFPAARIKSMDGITSHRLLLDGGVWCNNPSRLVCDAMMGYYKLNNLSDMAVISIGTGETSPTKIEAEAGLLHALPIVEALGRAHVTGVNESMQHLLGNRFHRIQPALGFNIDLDETRPEYLDYLAACAETQYLKIEDVVTPFLLRNFDLRYN